ncbi:MAG TPA: hypothetical protein VLA69_00745 [Gaiellaceae bacterium]|nr:hypothetical protein [Gaiellaceae bacterium]
MVVAPANERTVATPWGAATVVEEVSVPQRVAEKRFFVLVQLLETRSGERLVRYAYSTAGSARRGPVTMRVRDLERLRAALERAPVLARVLESASADSRARTDRRTRAASLP